MSGLKTEVISENVGTGDNSNASFDFDNKRVIATSYSLYYSSSSTSNSFTALSETTHYTLNAKRGTVVLTSAGITALAANVLWADYSYWGAENITDTDVDDWIDQADDEVDEYTGRKWDTATSYTEYFDGSKYRLDTYPKTDEPFDDDFNSDPTLVLRNVPVTEITNAYFLDRDESVSKLWSYNSSTAVYTDNTDEANTASGTAFYAFRSSPAAGDIIYIGAEDKFLGVQFKYSTVGVGTASITWEYYDGTTWSSLSNVTDVTSGAKSLTAAGKFTYDNPSGWTKTTVNSSSSIYWIRGRIDSGSFTTSPYVFEIALDPDSTINKEIAIKGIDFDSDTGRVTFMEDSIPFGTRNVKIEYKYGRATTPNLIKELSAVLASIRAYAHITGNSYDAMTSYGIGDRRVTIGEQYVNVREVLRQLETRREELLDRLGRRIIVVG